VDSVNAEYKSQTIYISHKFWLPFWLWIVSTRTCRHLKSAGVARWEGGASGILRDLTRIEALLLDNNEIGARGTQALMSSAR